MQILPSARKKRNRLGKTFYQSGQALLVILLTMAVVLTVVLSVASRSVTDIGITTYEEDALRAFSAAEAGVEEALVTGADTGLITLPNAATFDAVIGSGPDKEFIYPVGLGSGETATFWFVSQDSDGNLTCGGLPCLRASGIRVCWGGAGSPPAVEVSIFYDEAKAAVVSGNFSNVKVARLAYDPDGSRILSNKFESDKGSCTVLDKTFPYSTGNVVVASALPAGCATGFPAGCLLMARVRMFYNDTDHPVGIIVTGPTNLPPQGLQIESTGVAGDATRKVNVYRSFPEPAPLFDAAVFSLGDITKP